MGAAAASINRGSHPEWPYTLAIRAGKLLHAHGPYIAMQAEHNAGRDSLRRTSSRR